MRSIKDGDLYKAFVAFGESFELYYGYYNESDKQARFAEPLPIYPDFISEPRYTAEGFPLATDMQDICEHYIGKESEESCYACEHYERGIEMIGLCRCRARRRE